MGDVVELRPRAREDFTSVLGMMIALGAWAVPDPSKPDEGTAYLAKCTEFDEAAFSAFFSAYQFQGPERFPPDSLLPGRS